MLISAVPIAMVESSSIKENAPRELDPCTTEQAPEILDLLAALIEKGAVLLHKFLSVFNRLHRSPCSLFAPRATSFSKAVH